MLEALQERLARVTKTLRGEGHLTEYHVDNALREIRLALLEADVAVEVVTGFVSRVRERALGKEVLTSVTPAQMVTKIVQDELVGLLGGATTELEFKGRPAVVMLVGLQGSGKTTTAAKIAKWIKEKKNLFPLLVPADTSRPAAREQLMVLGEQAKVPTLDTRDMDDPEAIAERAMREARIKGYQVLIFDTAGRLHIDDGLMDQLERLKAILKPKQILFVADAMTGQDAVRSARAYHQRLDVTGVILTKLDGDARGGAALSVREVVGRPIVFAGVGERLEGLEQFHPDRMAGRILGMGDVASLVEKAQEVVDEKKAARLEAKLRKNEFDLEDLRDQLGSLKKMGPLQQVMDMVPGINKMMPTGGVTEGQERQLRRFEACIDSMTPRERRHPQLLNGSRKKRIARGSGTSVEEINRLLRQYGQMRKLMKRLGKADAKALKRQLGF
ncbi:MAG: signal recognition particle protein [Thermoanaerobaculales bacterium]|jgi:signal recognition particle subunit SRP54|nr:signal recognition particle protein [Thermoanaerobaculales bacterium]